MPTIHPNKTGLAFAALLGVWHLLWALCVSAGIAQWLLNFVLWLHFLNLPLTIAPFRFGTAALLVLFTAATGYIIGFVLAIIWNWLNRGATAVR